MEEPEKLIATFKALAGLTDIPGSIQTQHAAVQWAGCFPCADGSMQWDGKFARSKALQHHRDTGHEVWYDETTSNRWKKEN